MLGYAVLHFMHEQGMEYGPMLFAMYSDTAKAEDVEQLVDRAIDIHGVLDPVRYTRDSYVVVDVNKLHHQIALNMVDQDLMHILRKCAPEVYMWAKNNSTGNNGSFIRKTIGWDQFDINRKLWDSIIK